MAPLLDFYSYLSKSAKYKKSTNHPFHIPKKENSLDNQRLLHFVV